MKKSVLTSAIIALLSILNVGLQAQNATSKLNQIKLMESLWLGSWQSIISKDSILVSPETIRYGNVFEYNVFLVVGGEETFSFGGSYAYSPMEDNFKGISYSPEGNYQTWIGSFITETKFSIEWIQNFDSSKIFNKEVIDWESPAKYTVTFFDLAGAKTGVSKWIKVK